MLPIIGKSKGLADFCHFSGQNLCDPRYKADNVLFAPSDGLIEMTEIAAHTKFQILLAEDDKVNQSIVQAFLFGVNVELTIASDGREALEAALTNKFDLMIVDQNMPFITGDRVIRHLRAGRSINAATPVIRFTANADHQPFDLGVASVPLEVTLPKPLSRQALISTVGALLGGGLSMVEA